MSKSNTPQKKDRTPKSKQKEKWIETEDSSSYLSSDENIRIEFENTVTGLYISTEKYDLSNTSLLSLQLQDDIFFLSSSTMELIGVKIGDLCTLKINETLHTAICWPKVQGKLSNMILSNSIIKSVKKDLEIDQFLKASVKKTSEKCIKNLIKCRIKIFRNGDSEKLEMIESEQLCKYLTKLLTGKYLQSKQSEKIIFAGRRLTICFDEMSNIQQQLENLSIETSELFYLVCSDTVFYSKETLVENNTKRCLESKFFNLSLIERIQNQLINPIIHYERIPINITKGFIIHGQSGVGKTELLHYIISKVSESFSFNIKWIKSSEDLESFALLPKNSIAIIDNFENFANKDVNKNFTPSLLSTIDSSKKGHFFIISTNKMVSVEERLRNNGRFEVEIEFSVPNNIDRGNILKLLTEKMNLENIRITEIAERLHGFVASDICSLMKKAFLKSLELDKKLESDDILNCIKLITPSAMKTVSVSVQKVFWKDIGGSDSIRKSLCQLVEWPLKYPQKIKELGIRPPRGVLLYGPPGCSKTMIAKALATESDLKFLTIKGAELLSKYVGESERAIRTMFHKARQSAPSILFFDEIDAVAVTRGEQNSVVTDRMITTLLTELDGISDDAENNPVILIAATNRPHMIDSALLRPGRIDRFEYVSLPNLSSRVDILTTIFPEDTLDIDQKQDLAEKLQGYSGAEIVSIKHESAIFALERIIENPEKPSKIEMNDIERAMKKSRPRTKESDIEIYRKFATIHGQNIDEEI